MEKFTFTVNGKERTVECEPSDKLLDILRDRLDLTGAKRGCDNLSCAACTVVVNGKAEKSCMLQMKKVQGATITTVEGLGRGMDLHPVQQAIVDAGAVQCGYCIPGIVMEIFATLEQNPDPSEKEIFSPLNEHLCRCTGYEAIREGALLAVEYAKRARG